MRGVLITRPQPGASETAKRIEMMGLTPVVAPFLDIQDVACAPTGLDRIAATVLTSRNAVAFCPPACHDWPTFAVGDATARQARQAGFRDVRSAGADAAALAALVGATMDPRGGSLFLPTGRGQGQALTAELRGRGFRVVRRVAYEAVPPAVLPAVARQHLVAGTVSAALFFSADTAHHFVQLVRRAGLRDTVRGMEAMAISDRAIVALSALPWRRICVAAKPNQDAMLALLS